MKKTSRINNTLGAILFIVLLATGLTSYNVTARPLAVVPIFTGNAAIDFAVAGAVSFNDSSTDVGVPASAPVGTISGWNFTKLYFVYDSPSDTMYVGVDCIMICGDADGDGAPGGTSSWLSAEGGTDQPNLGNSESFTLLLDGNNDYVNFSNATGKFETAVGVSSSKGAGDISSDWGVYDFTTGLPGLPSLGYGALIPGHASTAASPSAGAPDLEFSIANFSTLPGFSFTPGEVFNFKTSLFAGSLEDDGIGEDYLPAQTSSVSVTIGNVDWTAVKTNNVGGSLAVGNPFNWSVAVSNAAGMDTATFASGDVIFRDNLPSGPAYGAVTVTPSGTTGTGTVACAIASNILTCTASGGTVKFPASASFTAAFSVTPAAAGSLVNPTGGVCKVDPNSLFTETDETNNTCSDTVTVTPVADLSITKTDGVAAVNAGGTTTYTVRVTNNGPSSVTGAILSDVAAAGLSKTAVACSATPGQCVTAPTVAQLQGGAFALPALTNGQFYEITITANVTALSGSVTNTATVATPVGTTDPTPGNNTASDTDTVTPVADLSITKTDGVAAVNVGGTTIYTVRVTNNGPSSVTGAILSDVAAAGLSKTAVACSATPGQCVTAPTVAQLEGGAFALPALTNGQFYEIRITADVTALSGSVTNTATVATPVGTTDPTPGNNTASDTDTVTPAADLSITKTDGVAAVNAGGTTTYTVRVTNNGPSSVTGAILSDVAAAGLSKTAVACSATPGQCVTAPTVAQLQGGAFALPALTNGQFYEITITANVTALSGSVTNTATVATPVGTNDPTPGNNSASDTDTVTPVADLSITKTDGVAAVNAGGTTIYTVRVTNNGPSSVTGAILSDVAAAGLSKTAVACSATPGQCVTAPTVAQLQGGAFALPALTNGQFYEITITANVTALSGSVTNTATVATPVGTTDPTPGNNTASDTDTVTPAADLSITKTDGVAAVNVGGTTIYTVRVTNNGPSSVTGAILSDVAAAGLSKTAVACSATPGQCVTAPTVAQLEGGAFALPALTNGQFYEITITADVTALSGSVTNTATVATPVGTNDPTPGNNTASDTDTVTPVADLSITKTDGVAAVNAGGTTTYTVRVTNNGPSSVTGAILSDVAAAGLSKTAVACSATPGQCVTAPTVAQLQGGAFALPALTNGQFYEITITANVTALSGSVTNTATVATPVGTTDPTPGNNTASDTDTVTPVADLSITKTDGVAAVNVGGTTIYTVRVTNNGPSSVTGAILSDVAAAGLSKTAVACSATPGQCVTAPTVAQLEGGAFALPALTNGQFYEIRITADVTALSGSVTNTATVATPVGTTDPTPGNNTASDTDTVTPAADLSITKTDGVAAVNVGGTTIYTVRVTNNGPSSVTGAILSDVAAAGLSKTAVACSATPGQCVTAPTVAQLEGGAFALPALTNGQFYEITITANVTALSGSVTNTATVATPVGTNDPTPGNNSASDTDTVQSASIGDFVWDDLNANGVQDGGEPGIVGVTVNLFTSAGVPAGSTTTGAGGIYSFTNLVPGDYYVEFTLDPTYDAFSPANQGVDTTDSDAETVVSATVMRTATTTLTAGENDLTWDAGMYKLASLGDFVWHDLDANGVQDVGEPGIVGVTVNLFTSAGVPAGSTTTGAGGIYSFTNLVPGDYYVEFTLATGYAAFSPANQGADTTDSDAETVVSATVMRTATTTLTAGENDLTWDAGMYKLASLGDFVWHDLDANGVQDGGLETGFDGVTVNLYDSANALVATTTTAGGGFYSFTSLTPDVYHVGFVKPLGYTFSPLGAGTTATDSDANLSTGQTTPTTLISGENDLTWDAGLYTAASLGDFVWDDLNANGVQDGGEPGIVGVTVNLFTSAGVPAGSTTTGAGGIYSFTNLAAGDYYVEFTLDPTYATFSPANQGVDTTDSDAETVVSATVMRTATTTLTAGENDLTWDAGMYNPLPNLSVSKTVTSTGPYVLGDTVSYNIVVTNTGNVTLTGVTVTDNSATVGACTPAQPSTLALNAAMTCPASHLVTQADVNNGSYANTATGDSDQTTPSDSTVTVNFTQSPAHTTVKSETSTGPYAAGDTINYSIVVTNTGNVTLTGVTVTDNSATVGACTPVQPSTLAPNAAMTCPASHLVTQADVNNGSYANTATGDSDQTTPSDDTVTVNLISAQIQIVKIPSATVINSGGSVTYSYVVTNPGAVSLTNVSVTDDKCSPVTYVSGDTNTNNTLETTETWNYTCITTLTATTTNIATVSGTSGIVLVQDTDTATVNVVSSGMEKIITGTSETFTTGNNVAIGEIVTYQITMNLPIGLALDNVVVTDRMDKGLAFVDCVSVNLAGTDITSSVCPPTVSAITDPGNLPTNPANPGRQAQFNIGSVTAPAAASTLVIQYRAIVLDVIENQETDALNNSVTLTWTGGSLTASAPDVTIVEPDLAIDKSATPTTVTAGDSIQFTLTISHTALSSTDAFDVVVTDVLPDGLEYIACTPITYSGVVPTTQPDPCNIPGGNTLTFGWDSFPFNQSATVVLFARFDGTKPILINTASVSWTSLPIDHGSGGNPVELSTYNDTSTERGYDPNDLVNIYQVVDGVGINMPAGEEEEVDLPSGLPATGFAPNVITALPEQPAEKSYAATDVWLEIPSLGVNIPIVGVPLVEDDWDVSWLWKQAGWLNGTAFPGWQGNSALTGHVTLPNGKSGPFVGLGKLKWGDKILVHAYGSVYTYEVRQNRTVSPNNTSVLKHEDDAWLTLITCKTYNEETNTYARRIAVRATLVSVELEKQVSTSKGGR